MIDALPKPACICLGHLLRICLLSVARAPQRCSRLYVQLTELFSTLPLPMRRRGVNPPESIRAVFWTCMQYADLGGVKTSDLIFAGPWIGMQFADPPILNSLHPLLLVNVKFAVKK